MKSDLIGSDRVRLLVLFSFVFLVAGRDLAFTWMHKSVGLSGLSFAFLLCVLVAAVSACWLVVVGGFGILVERMRRPGVFFRSACLGFLGAVVYGVTFVAIELIGPGLFNLLDWGLAPIFTLILGVIYWQEKLRPGIVMALLISLVGVTMLSEVDNKHWNIPNILFALFSPVATSLSFSVQKWLLDKGGLSYSHVLLVRFAPAAAFIWFFMEMRGQQVVLGNGLLAVLVAAIFGYLPLLLLCSALVKNTLNEFAAWLFAIPAITLYGGLVLIPDTYEKLGGPLPLIGATLILSSLAGFEILRRREDKASSDMHS